MLFRSRAHRCSAGAAGEVKSDIVKPKFRTPNQIGPKILAECPVWEFVNDDEHPLGETAMRPVHERPVRSFDGRIFGTRVELADGSMIWAMISDLGFGPQKYRHHFRSLTVFAKGKRFHLANYFQIWYRQEGPVALAAFLGKPTQAVFPISYDFTALAEGPADVVRGTFDEKISDPIPRAKLMEIIVKSTKSKL